MAMHSQKALRTSCAYQTSEQNDHDSRVCDHFSHGSCHRWAPFFSIDIFACTPAVSTLPFALSSSLVYEASSAARNPAVVEVILEDHSEGFTLIQWKLANR